MAQVPERPLLPCLVGRESELCLADQLVESAFDQPQDGRGICVRLMDLPPALRQPLDDKFRGLFALEPLLNVLCTCRSARRGIHLTISRPATVGPSATRSPARRRPGQPGHR